MLKKAFAETRFSLKKSAVSEVDPCGGMEKHPTRIRYEINKYCDKISSVNRST